MYFLVRCQLVQPLINAMKVDPEACSAVLVPMQQRPLLLSSSGR